MQIISKISASGSVSRYQPGDEKLFISKTIQRNFGVSDDYAEFHVYDINDNLLNSNYDYKNYRPSSLDRINGDGSVKTIELDPGQDLINLGYKEGDLTIKYNFFKKKIFNEIGDVFFIKEISQDRTEIRVATNILNNDELEAQVNNLINEINTTQYYKDYLLNFGNNNLLVTINVAIDKNEEIYTVLFKLYEPLPLNIGIKDTFWVVDEIVQSPIYQLDLANYIQEQQLPQLRGANFDINLSAEENSTLNYHNYNQLLATSSFSSSYNQVLNILNQKGININVDYTEYANFINFSSITERLENFKYKLQLIEAYNSQSYVLNNILTSSNYVNENQILIKNKIDNIINKFDGYEYFLYYESGSKSWPKQSSTKPYINQPSTSSYAISWFNTELVSASLYDEDNINNLEYTVPDYIKEDTQNEPYMLFLNMIGQHFDNIWIFIKSITDVNLGDNKLTEGISKDLIKDTLKSLGVKLYNSNSNTNLFEYLIGSSERGTFKYVYGEPTGSYPTNLVTASTYTTPKDDLNKEILKRIYHNLPLLLKSKGTSRGLRAFINCFGIPDTILRINEFGGSDKSGGSYETNFNRYFYATYLNPSGSIRFPWENLTSSSLKPSSVEFRFKLSSSYNIPTQSLFEAPNFKIELIKTGSTNGIITFKTNNQPTGSIILPFNNNDWWNVLLTKNSTTYILYVRNNINNRIGFTGSISFFSGNTSTYNTSGTASLGNSGSIYFSELRYWSEVLDVETFNKHVLNPESYEGNGITSSYYNLGMRLPLGNNLNTSSIQSVHPNQNRSVFASGSFFATTVSSSYINQEEQYYANSFGGGFVRVNDKFRIKDNNLSGSVLSQYIRLEQISGSELSPDLHFVEVDFSPINEINNEISNQLSGFNLDNYIGNPAELYSSSYESLENLKLFYFQKYLRSFNYNDYIRLIKFFDNSLFRFIKDFVPSRSNTITGITIESPILERNKIKQTKPQLQQDTGSDFRITSASIGEDKTYIYNYLSGNKSPFYTGIFSGSILNINDYFRLGPYNHDIRIINYSASISGSTEILIYDENNEWSGSYIGLSPDFNSTENPYRNTKSIKINTSTISAPNIELTSPTSITLSNFNEIEFYIYKTNGLFSNTITVQWFYTGSAISKQVSLTSGSYGYNRSVNDSWQKVNIPISDFFITGSGIGALTLIFDFDPINPLTYDAYLDYIRLLNNNGASIIFNTSVYSVLNYNYMDSRISDIKLKIDGKYNNRDVYTKARLQDSYDDLRTHQESRYDGVKTISQYYNDYTVGDRSFGKTAAIDKNVRKIGIFTEIVSSSFLPKYSNVHLKYLVDESGSLTDLNIRNKNWFEVQNTFVAGEDLLVSLFNNQKYSNQKRTDGIKKIFESGYSYYPLFYHITGSGEEAVFEYTEISGSNLFKVLITSGTFEPKVSTTYPTTIQTGSYTTSVSYNGTGRIVPTIFNFTGQSGEYNDGSYYTNGVLTGGSTASYYVIPRNGVYSFTWDFTLRLALSAASSLPTSSLFEVRITEMVSGSIIGQDTLSTAGFSGSSIGANKLYVDTNHPIFHKVREQVGVATLSGTTEEYTSNVLTNTFPNGVVTDPIVLDRYRVGRRWYSNHYTAYYINQLGPDSTRYIGYEDNSGGGFSYLYNFNGTAITSLNSGSVVKFEFFVSGTQNYTASILPGGYLRADPGSGGTPNITDPFMEFNVSGSYIDIIDELATFINNDLYIFNPTPSGSVSNLYQKYGAVDYSFVLSLYDKIVLSRNSGTTTYIFSIIRMERISDIRFRIYVSPNLPTDIWEGLYEILFLKRVNDETNVIVRLNKPDGKTSYGTIVSDNIHPDVLKNIDTITKESKQKLLDEGVNTIEIDGGTY